MSDLDTRNSKKKDCTMSKKWIAGVFGVVLLSLGTLLAVRADAADRLPNSGYEYATIRWDGRDNTHVIRPGGKVEHIGQELKRMKRPSKTDDRSFYMNLAMNGLAIEGYVFAGMTEDEIVMRRPLR